MKLLALAVAALSLTAPALATNLVVNGSFESTSLGTKGNFAGNVTGWSGGANLTYLNYPGTATTAYLAVYPGFAATSPDGGNFAEMDGDPSYSDAIYQSISGLTIGQTYTVNFFQAAGQQNGFTGPTTERWAVSLGATTQLSNQYSLPQGATGPWQAQSMKFVAAGTTQVLSFLAVGTPNGAPPISFLDGVSLAVPEPASWAMMLAGFGIVGAAMRRRVTSVAVAA